MRRRRASASATLSVKSTIAVAQADAHYKARNERRYGNPLSSPYHLLSIIGIKLLSFCDHCPCDMEQFPRGGTPRDFRRLPGCGSCTVTAGLTIFLTRP